MIMRISNEAVKPNSALSYSLCELSWWKKEKRKCVASEKKSWLKYLSIKGLPPIWAIVSTISLALGLAKP